MSPNIMLMEEDFSIVKIKKIDFCNINPQVSKIMNILLETHH
jgi:hypothetical protein